MTVYGGEKTIWGSAKDGFFVSCTKCGWHSEVEVTGVIIRGDVGISFECNHCGNKYEDYS